MVGEKKKSYHTYEMVGGVGYSKLGGIKGSEQLSTNGLVGLKTASTGWMDTRGWSHTYCDTLATH